MKVTLCSYIEREFDMNTGASRVVKQWSSMRKNDTFKTKAKDKPKEMRSKKSEDVYA